MHLWYYTVLSRHLEKKTVRFSLSYRQKLQDDFWRKEPSACSCQGKCSQDKWFCVLLTAAGDRKSMVSVALG